MNEETRKLVERAEELAEAKPRDGGVCRGYATLSEACEDVLALCKVVRELETKIASMESERAAEDRAWEEYNQRKRERRSES
jgi:hypothetical protein